MKTDSSKKSYSYKDAGVDIVAGNSLVEAIKPLAASPRRTGADFRILRLKAAKRRPSGPSGS